MAKETKKNFTVRITPKMYRDLEKEAKKLGISKGEVIRNAIKCYFIELF